MITYLASPYSHPDPAVRLARFQAACRAAAHLMQIGHTVFSPIAHSHPIAEHLPAELLMSWDFWRGQDFPLLELAGEVVVMTLDGWKESRGVQAEIAHAEKHGIPIRYMDPVP